MLDGLRPRVAPSEALSLGSLALEAQKSKGDPGWEEELWMGVGGVGVGSTYVEPEASQNVCQG